MGSAAAYHVARRRKRVVGIEQYTPAHSLGASHGKSRIIREAYFEHPAYVPLIQRAYELWEALQRDAGTPLLRITRGLMVGPPEGELVQGALASAKEHHLPHELLAATDIRRRFPVLQPDPNMVGVLELRAGVLFPEDCVRAHLTGATHAGAELHFEEPVVRWKLRENFVEITTSRRTYVGNALVVTPGPWAAQLLEELRLPLTVQRNVMFWFRPARNPEGFAPERFPIYIWEYDRGAFFYGFPALGSDGLKIARHYFGEACTPETLRREVAPEEIDAMRVLLARYLPAGNGPALGAVACMYTNTPDGHFVIDHHPDSARVTIACGFSGHGFKFASVVGEILADLALDGTTAHPIGLFQARRFV